MKLFKSILATTAFTAITLAALPVSPVHALANADMYLSGATNNNGEFSAVVYENTGSDTVTGANVDLTFSQAVSSVAYDYSVGPFTATTPSGAHNAYGTVTGTNPVARVSFKLANPGTVTATVSGNAYLKHVEGTTVQSFAINRGSADFTYNVPAPVQTPPQTTNSTPTATNGTTVTSSSKSTAPKSAVASATTTKVATTIPSTPITNSEPAATNAPTDAANNAQPNSSDKNITSKTASNSHANTWLWILLALAAVSIYYFVTLRRRATADAAEARKPLSKRPSVSPTKKTAAKKSRK